MHATVLPRPPDGAHYPHDAENVEDTLKLLSTDEGSGAEVPEWVNKVEHQISSNEKIDGVSHIKIRKPK